MANIKTVKDDALIDIQVSGAYYKLVYNHILKCLDNEEDPKSTLEKISSNEPLSLNQASLKLLLALVYEIETEANTQNKLEDIKQPEDDTKDSSQS